MEIDYSKPGSFTGEVKVKKLTKSNGKGSFYWVKLEGFNRDIKCWTTFVEQLGESFKEGAEASATILVKDDKDQAGAQVFVPWLETWNGQSQAKRGGGTGGGGGARSSYTPKSAEEIHSASICGIIKSAIESQGNDFDKIASRGIDIYFNALKRVGSSAQQSAPIAEAAKPAAAAPVSEELPLDPNQELIKGYLANLGLDADLVKHFKSECKESGQDWKEVLIEAHQKEIDNFDSLMELVVPDTNIVTEAQVIELGKEFGLGPTVLVQFKKIAGFNVSQKRLRAQLDAIVNTPGASLETHVKNCNGAWSPVYKGTASTASHRPTNVGVS